MAALGASAAAFAPTFVRAQNAQNAQSLIHSGWGTDQKFDPALVLDIARQLARRPFMPVASDLRCLHEPGQEQYAAIKALPPQIWADGRGISVDRCTGVRVQQPGWIALGRGWARSPRPVRAGPVRLRSAERTGDLPDLGFSGFKLLSTFGNGQPVEFATVQGATFFRAVARGRTYGAVARALTLKPAETRGEEFPVFQAFWLDLHPGRTL